MGGKSTYDRNATDDDDDDDDDNDDVSSSYYSFVSNFTPKILYLNISSFIHATCPTHLIKYSL